MSEKTPTRIKERPLIFVDLEFTGLEFHKHEILQFGVVVVNQLASPAGGPDFKVVREWECKVRAVHIETADPQALRIVGYTEEKWRDAIPLGDALKRFDELARDGVLVGWNVAMDFLYLKKAYADAGMIPSFHWQVLDVMSMAFDRLYATPLKEFRMGEITEHFKIKNDKHHDALADAQMTYEMFLKLKA